MEVKASPIPGDVECVVVECGSPPSAKPHASRIADSAFPRVSESTSRTSPQTPGPTSTNYSGREEMQRNMPSYWFTPETVTFDFGGRPMTIETGRLAKQAAGAALVTYGETAVLVTATRAEPRPGIDFFPLTV